MKTTIWKVTAETTSNRNTKAVAQVLKIILKEAKILGFIHTIIESKRGENKESYESVLFLLKGKSIQEFCDSWQGKIRWTETVKYLNQIKAEHSTIRVAIQSYQELELQPKDIRFESMKSAGKGGQHVNKVNTAVRLIHLPTGISVQSSQERSQLRNKNRAMEKLQVKLLEWEQSQLGQMLFESETFETENFKRSLQAVRRKAPPPRKSRNATSRQQAKKELNNELKNW